MPTFVAEKGTVLNPNNGLTIQQIDALNKLAGVNTTYTSPTLSPAGQGMYRQSPNVFPPSSMSGFELQKEFWDTRNNQRINTPRTPTPNSSNIATPVAKPNVVQQMTSYINSPIANGNYRTPSNPPLAKALTNYSNSPIAQAYNKISNSPNAQRIANGLNTAGAKFESGLGRATSGLVAVQSAVQIGTSLANAVKNPNLANFVGTGIDVASTALAFTPHPLAKAAGILLAIGKPLITSFFGSPQNAPVQGVPASFTGGQVETLYNVSLDVIQTTLNDGASYRVTRSAQIFGKINNLRILNNEPATSGASPSNGVLFGWVTPYVSPQLFLARFPFGAGTVISVENIQIARADGQPDSPENPAPIVAPIPAPTGDGFQSPDLSGIESRLDDFQSRLGDLQSGINNLQGLPNLLADLKGLRANNATTPYVPSRTPSPLPMPRDVTKIVPTPTTTPNITVYPVVNNPVSKSPVTTPNQTLNPAKQATPTGKPAPAPSKTPQQQKDLDDRFKQCCEPSFSSIKVKKFDKCEDGAPKFVEIAISVPKGTETATAKLFESVANTEGLQCSMNSVVTFPDSWAGKVPDDRPQAVVYYREWNGSKWGDYTHSVSIPHYSKPKGFKPTLPIIKKGSFFGILKFKDNSQIYVNCESINEAKRVLNALKQFSGIQAKGARPKFGEYGDGDLKRVTTKAVRLDFYSKGRGNTLADWSVQL